MAQQFYIDNGINVNPAWFAHIAVSQDGVQWTPIAKAGLDITPVIRKVSVNPLNPLSNKEQKCIIQLKRGGDDRPIVEFDVDNVANQAAWLSGATIIDKCIAAVTDITIWAGDATGGGGSTVGLATESTLNMVLAAIQNGQDFEAKLVVDDNGDGDTYLEVRIWNPDTQTWETPLYYMAGSNTGVPAGSLTAPIIYINPAALLGTIAANTTGLATEVTLASLEAKLNSLGQKASADSAPVVLSTEQEVILNAIKTAVEAIDLDTDGLATEATLLAGNALLTTIDGVLDNIKLDTANLDVALSTRSSEATLLATNTLLTTIDNVLDAILLDTASIANDIGLVEGYIAPATRTHNTVIATGIGSVPAGSLRGSVLNNGSASATWNGISLPAGISIPWGDVANRDDYGAIAYDATGTSLIIEYTT